MKFDKLSLFADGLAVPATASATTYSKSVDLRLCGQAGIDGCLKVWAGVVGAANATGSVTTKLQTFDGDGSGVVDVASEVQDGRTLMAMALPCRGLKRFVRLAFSVGSTALGSAVSVKAGLVDQFDVEELPTVQGFPPLEDLAEAGDRVNEALAVAETTKTIAKGASAEIAVTSGLVVSATAPTGYTVTASAGKVTVALSSTAASGSVVLSGSDGTSKTVAVTASS